MSNLERYQIKNAKPQIKQKTYIQKIYGKESMKQHIKDSSQQDAKYGTHHRNHRYFLRCI